MLLTLRRALVGLLIATPGFADTSDTAAPGRQAALLAEAVAAFDSYELAKAGQLLDGLELQSGRSATLLYYRTRILTLRNRADAALKVAQQCIAAYPQASRCHEALADARITAAFASGKTLDIVSGARAAKDSWEKALALDPANARAGLLLVRYNRQAPWPLGSASRARELERQIASHDAAAGAQAQGLNLLSDKNYPAAVAALRRAITLQPGDRDARFYLVTTYLAAKQYREAAAAGEDMITRYPKFWIAWFTLGYLHFDGKLDANRGIVAMRTFLANAERPPPQQRAAALACIGAFEERLGHVDAARSAFQQALALNGDDKNAKEGLARLPRG